MAEFHDSSFIGLNISESCAAITVLTTRKKIIKVEFTGVQRLMCNDFREGNIVLDFGKLEIQSQQEYYLSKLFSVDQTIDTPKYIMDVMSKLNDDILQLYLLSPSYGGELIVLCNEIKILQDL